MKAIVKILTCHSTELLMHFKRTSVLEHYLKWLINAFNSQFDFGIADPVILVNLLNAQLVI